MAQIDIRMTSDTSHATAGISRVGSHLGVLGQQLQQLKAIGAAYLSVSGVYNMARATLAWSDQTSMLSEQLGITTDRLQALQFMAIRNNVEWPIMEQMMRRIRVSLDDANSGVDRSVKIWQTLGATQRQIAEADMATAIGLFAKAAKEADPRKLTAMFDIEGTKVGPRVMGALKAMADMNMGDFENEMKKSGKITETELIDKVADADQAFKEFAQTVKSFSAQVIGNWVLLGQGVAAVPANFKRIGEVFAQMQDNMSKLPWWKPIAPGGMLRTMAVLAQSFRQVTEEATKSNAAFGMTQNQLNAIQKAAEKAEEAWKKYAEVLANRDPVVGLRVATGDYEDQLAVVRKLKDAIDDLDAKRRQRNTSLSEAIGKDSETLRKLEERAEADAKLHQPHKDNVAEMRKERDAARLAVAKAAAEAATTPPGIVTGSGGRVLNPLIEAKERLTEANRRLADAEKAAQAAQPKDSKVEAGILKSNIEAKRELIGKDPFAEEENALRTRLAQEEEKLPELWQRKEESVRRLKEETDKLAQADREYRVDRVEGWMQEAYWLGQIKRLQREIAEGNGKIDLKRTEQLLEATKKYDQLRDAREDEEYKKEQERLKAIEDGREDLRRIARDTTGESVEMRGGPWASAGGWMAQASMLAPQASREAAVKSAIDKAAASMPKAIAEALAPEIAKLTGGRYE